MKATIELERKHYKIELELSEDEIAGMDNLVEDSLRRIDTALQKSCKVWHVDIPAHLVHFVEILPNGCARFPVYITSQIDQLLLIIAIAGKGGISSSEVASVLDLPVTTVTGYYQQPAYEELFKATERGGYRLSTSGLERLSQLLERLHVKRE